LPVAPEDAKQREIECENPDCTSSKYQRWQEKDGEPEEPKECYKCGSEIKNVGESENCSKAPNVSNNYDGPTTSNWRKEENLYTWEEVEGSSWNRWGIVEWNEEKRLLIIDFDFYEFEDKERVEEIIKELNKISTRTHKSQSGGVHAFFLVKPEDLDGNNLPISLVENVDDKLNGYVLSHTCEGYEVEISGMPKTIDPRELPNCIKKSEVVEAPEDNSDIEYPTELDEDLYCFRKLSEKPSEISEGKRRYACMVLAGHLRDQGVPKTIAKNYIKNFWSKLKQPPEAGSKRTWSDVKRVINDYYDESKDYRVGCKTVNRYFSEYCEREKCPLGARLNAIENEENVVIDFDKRGLNVELLNNDKKVAELVVKKIGNKNFEHKINGKIMRAESLLGLMSSDSTKQKKRSWFRKAFEDQTGKEIDPTIFKKKYWDPLVKKIQDNGILEKSIQMQPVQIINLRDMVRSMKMERSTDPNVNYPIWLDVSYDGIEGVLKLDSKKILSVRNVKSAFLKEFGTLPEELIEVNNKEWQRDVIGKLKSEGKVETFEELDSTQIYLINQIKRRLVEGKITEDSKKAVSRMNFVLYKDDLLWIESERVKEVLEEERSNPNLSRVREWFGPELVEVGKQIWVGKEEVKKKRFWGFDPEKMEEISREEIERRLE